MTIRRAFELTGFTTENFSLLFFLRIRAAKQHDKYRRTFLIPSYFPGREGASPFHTPGFLPTTPRDDLTISVCLNANMYRVS